MSLCRICSANDKAALVEDIAQAMWGTQRSSDPADEWQPWEQAGAYWQRVMRQFAEATVKTLRAEHQV